MNVKPTILSVEDEENFAELLKQYFEPRGYEIDVAPEGNEGIRLLKEKKYDVVLLDLKMAGLNGDEVMREIKRIDRGIKIIFISAFSDSGRTKQKMLDEGAYAFLEKPITSLKILEDIVISAARTT